MEKTFNRYCELFWNVDDVIMSDSSITGFRDKTVFQIIDMSEVDDIEEAIEKATKDLRKQMINYKVNRGNLFTLKF